MCYNSQNNSLVLRRVRRGLARDVVVSRPQRCLLLVPRRKCVSRQNGSMSTAMLANVEHKNKTAAFFCAFFKMMTTMGIAVVLEITSAQQEVQYRVATRPLKYGIFPIIVHVILSCRQISFLCYFAIFIHGPVPTKRSRYVIFHTLHYWCNGHCRNFRCTFYKFAANKYSSRRWELICR